MEIDQNALSGKTPELGHESILPLRSYRSRAVSTPNSFIVDDSALPPGFGMTPTSGYAGQGSSRNSLVSQWPNSANQAQNPSIWVGNESNKSPLLSAGAIGSRPQSRQHRSLSFHVPPTTSNDEPFLAFQNRAANSIIPELLEVGDMTEEEYANVPKGRSRSKSSSAIYGFDEEIPPPPSVPDMSSIWGDPKTQESILHRRASTQPNNQSGMWEAMRVSQLSAPFDVNVNNTEELLERYKQDQANQRRFSVAPSVINRFVNKYVVSPNLAIYKPR